MLTFFIPIPTYAQVHISASIPGTYDTSNAATASPGQFIADFYQYALVIGGILAFGVIVYGGIRYMTSAGNPSGQGDAKEWVQAAIMGILLLAGAYFILKVINPNLVNLSLPSLQSVGQVNTSGGTGSGAGGGSGTSGGGSSPTDSQAAKDLASAGVSVKSGATVAGLRNSIVNSLTSLRSECGGCNVTVTAGTDGIHQPGEYSHADGYKADVRLDAGLNSYITNNFASIGTRSDGAAMYKDPSTGAIYARESSHWDIVSKG